MFRPWIRKVSPLAARFSGYGQEQLVGDLIAGLVVAIMLVPQAMAYAMLAGLPAQTGLYASIVPLVLYSLFGTSNSLSVGPVAMISILVFSGVGGLAEPGSPAFIKLCLTLALMVGVLQIGMAAFRLGFLVNFISHPVLVGFTSAAAIVIGFSQVKHLAGMPVSNSEYPIQLIANTIGGIGSSNLTTLVIGLSSCVMLVFFGFGLVPLLKKIGVNKKAGSIIAKFGPLAVVLLAATSVFAGHLDQSSSVSVVGTIPEGFPGLAFPDLNLLTIRSLLPLALTITIVGYLESISVAKTLASRKREKVNANRELFALGMADIGAAFSGGFPVTGGLSRSMVNFQSGVCTPLGSVFTAVLVLISVLFLTPLFFYIPNTVLASIVIVAVAPLVDFRTPLKLWHYSRADAIALFVTFLAVLAMGIETGILTGIIATIVMLMWKMSRPHVAEVGRLGESEHFRNINRYDVRLVRGLLAFRVDESLNFANAPFLHFWLLDRISERPEIKSVLLISSGINDIDATGLEVLDTLHQELKELGIGFYMSDVKGPVMDRLQLAACYSHFPADHIYLSADEAVRELTPAIHDSHRHDKSSGPIGSESPFRDASPARLSGSRNTGE